MARLATTSSPLAPPLRDRLRRVTPISGLHDLKRLMLTKMNATLQIDAGEALRESPAFLMPLPGVAITAWVGAAERPEFLRQNDLLGTVWPGVKVHRATARHHFDVLDPLVDPVDACPVGSVVVAPDVLLESPHPPSRGAASRGAASRRCAARARENR